MAVEFDAFHFAVTGTDVVIHDGYNATSVLDKRARRAFFQDIDVANKGLVFCFKNPFLNEIFVAYPSIGATSCNKALVYNFLIFVAFAGCYILTTSQGVVKTMDNTIEYKKDRLAFWIDLGITTFMMVWFVISLLSNCAGNGLYHDRGLINPHNGYYYFLHSMCDATFGTICVLAVISIGHYALHLTELTYDLVQKSAIPGTVSAWYHKACPVIKIEKKEEDNL